MSVASEEDESEGANESTPRELSEDEADAPTAPNVGMPERVVSAVAGGVLVGYGLTRRSLRGLGTAAAGSALLARGVRGQSRLFRAFGVNTAEDGAALSGTGTEAMVVEQSITVDGSPEDLAEYWRDPEQLSRIVGHFASVRQDETELQHWAVEGPRGLSTSWASRLVTERPEELLRWESVEGSAVPNEWSVWFKPSPAEDVTEVTLRVDFQPPGGPVGGMALQRLGLVPKTLVSKSLHRFKSLVETGEIPTLEANPSGRGRGDAV